MDHEILQKEIGVSSKIHRIKIIKSIKELVDGSKAEAQPPLARADSRLISQIEATGTSIYANSGICKVFKTEKLHQGRTVEAVAKILNIPRIYAAEVRSEALK